MSAYFLEREISGFLV
ncbi:hypothetical protein Pint_13945 [Pistacia integerrima]|uniref:Uncharacterized protein n=2 Tax=Pistacia TaxID=55512 RepID=A0ACC1AVC9_9ROSI|nr:hypothetical protein Pint_13945 [Pistacia integerrima]KAJ0090584.1 hypothetical protein Patl1_14076 [Pistacia atlantica]